MEENKSPWPINLTCPFFLQCLKWGHWGGGGNIMMIIIMDIHVMIVYCLPRERSKFIKTESFVGVCQFVSTLMAERIDVRSWNLTQESSWPWWNLGWVIDGQVKGQGHKVKKRDVYDILASVPVYKMLAYVVTLWCNVTSVYDVRRHSMKSSVCLLWDRLGMREVQQHFNVFF